MATKQVTILPPEEMGITIPARALDAYRFALAHAGIEMDEEAEAEFISKRNLYSVSFRELWEVKAKLEKVVASINEVCKHTYNVGGIDSLPPEGEDGVKISWSKQSYTYEWMVDDCGEEVANRLVEKGLIPTIGKILNAVPVATFAKACGIQQDKFMELFPEFVCGKAKARTLSIK